MTPLSPRIFHLLLAVSDGSLNGYQIMTRVEENSSGRVRVGPGTLYEALHRLKKKGWLEEVAGDSAGPSDGRGQRYYRLSGDGARVLRAETERLASDLQVAKSLGVWRGGDR